MKEISFFTTYDQRENRITNYCLLILKQIYSYSPFLFNQLISNITRDGLCNFGVSFNQQKGINTECKKQIADGIIQQDPITVYIETKRFNWFYNEQIFGYLDNLNKQQGTKILLLLSNFEDDKEDDKIEKRIKEIKQKQKYSDIEISSVNFIDLFDELKNITYNIRDDIFQNIINDFENFLVEEKLSPIWKYRLDIVKCSKTMKQNLENKCYSCPLKKGAYSHRRSLYMGLLGSGKTLKKIAVIDGVVNITLGENKEPEFNIEYNNIDSEKQLIDRAKEILKNKSYYGWNDLNNGGLRLFLLSSIEDLEYGCEKDSTGGRLGGKIYLNLSDYKPKNISEVKSIIDKKKWNEFR